MTAKYLLLCIPLFLVGCFFDSAEEAEKIKNADSHAVGAACRQNLRGIEDCFTLNPFKKIYSYPLTQTKQTSFPVSWTPHGVSAGLYSSQTYE